MDWKKVSNKFAKTTGRSVTPNFLKSRYKQIKPDFEHDQRKLTEEDDQLIMNVVEEYGEDWEMIFQKITTIDPIKLRNRYYSKIKAKMGNI